MSSHRIPEVVVAVIDLGTDGTTYAYLDPTDKSGWQVMAAGQADVGFVTTDEQDPLEYVNSVRQAREEADKKLEEAGLAADSVRQATCVLGIAGQMHGRTLFDGSGNPVGNTLIWRHGCGDDEAGQLTEEIGLKVPKRMTLARLFWTSRNDSGALNSATRVTTPAGFVHFKLTGQHRVSIGEASGMCLIDPESVNSGKPRYLPAALTAMKELSGYCVRDMLPEIALPGNVLGRLDQHGASITGLPVGTRVGSVQGDQQASLVFGRIHGIGAASWSFGTSSTFNALVRQPYGRIHPAVDVWSGPEGSVMNMICAQLGMTPYDLIFDNIHLRMPVDVFYSSEQLKQIEASQRTCLDAKAMQVDPDAARVLSIFCHEGEQALGLLPGAVSAIFGLGAHNFTPGVLAHSALLGSSLTVASGIELLRADGLEVNEITLSGGATKGKDGFIAQMVADAANCPVLVPPGADEGTAIGAGYEAFYAFCCDNTPQFGKSWGDYLDGIPAGQIRRFQPHEKKVALYAEMRETRDRLVSEILPQIAQLPYFANRQHPKSAPLLSTEA